MIYGYEICSAGRRVGFQQAPTALQALLDHLRLLGCHDEDIVRLGTDSVAWRGAVYRADLANTKAPASS